MSDYIRAVLPRSSSRKVKETRQRKRKRIIQGLSRSHSFYPHLSSCFFFEGNQPKAPFIS
jgi:hypothetical protein